MNYFKDKTVVLGVSGGIAAYKAADLTSNLIKLGADVHVIMTANACNFIHPITFETLTGHKCLIDTFDRNFEFQVEHISLAKMADVFIIAPATANVIAKIVHGQADDMLTTTFLAATCPKIIAPAMNTNMYLNPITQDNFKLLKKYHMEMIEAASGHLACGDTGVGKLPDVSDILKHIECALVEKKDLIGKSVLVTAGPTMERIDPVRFLSNHSTGKMGYAIAKACMLRGADITLVTGKVTLEPPLNVNVVPIESAQQMYQEVIQRFPSTDIVIKAAAVADYRPSEIADEKVKKSSDNLCIELERTTDILKALGEQKSPKQFLCGFSMETENMIANSKKKLEKKNLDLIVANNLKESGAGFGTDTNVVTFITKNDAKELELMSKNDVADKIIDQILCMIE